MAIRVECDHCFRDFRVKDTAAGKKIHCPGCDTVLRIPRPRPKSKDDEFEDALDSLDDDEFQDLPAPPPPRRTATKARKKKKSRSSSNGDPVTPQLAWRVIGGIMGVKLLFIIIGAAAGV